MLNMQKTFTINLNSSLSNPNSKLLKLTYVTNNYLCYGDYSGSLIGKANVTFLKDLLGYGNVYLFPGSISSAEPSALDSVLAEYPGVGLGYFPLALEERFAHNTTVLWVLTPESIEAAKDCQALIALKESTIAVLKTIAEPEGYAILDEEGYYELLTDYRDEYLQEVTVPKILWELNEEVAASVNGDDAEAFFDWCDENARTVLEILRDTCSYLGEYPDEIGNGLTSFGFSPSRTYNSRVRRYIYDIAQDELPDVTLPI